MVVNSLLWLMSSDLVLPVQSLPFQSQCYFLLEYGWSWIVAGTCWWTGLCVCAHHYFVWIWKFVIYHSSCIFSIQDICVHSLQILSSPKEPSTSHKKCCWLWICVWLLNIFIYIINKVRLWFFHFCSGQNCGIVSQIHQTEAWTISVLVVFSIALTEFVDVSLNIPDKPTHTWKDIPEGADQVGEWVCFPRIDEGSNSSHLLGSHD